MERTILHVDMDAFFASVEQRDNPALRGMPVLVGGGRGGTGKRGVVTTASYEARVFGCRSAMPMAQARRLCPQAVVVPVRMEAYAEANRRIMEVLDEFTPEVQPVSIDEAFMDVTRSLHLFGDGMEIGRRVKVRIRAETGLPASVGLGPNKFLAKVASDAGKPDGLMEIKGAEAARVLGPMSVRTLFGIGPKTGAMLERLGIRTVADFRAADRGLLKRTLGDQAEVWGQLAVGEDARVVHVAEGRKSIGKERTFGDDVADPERLRATLLQQVESVARRMREEGLKAGRLTVKLRTGDFHTVTRAVTLEHPTDSTDELWRAARGVFDAWQVRSGSALRLIGVALSELQQGGQPMLFAEPVPRREKLDAAADLIARKFGAAGVQRAAGLSGGRRDRPGRGGARGDRPE